MQPERLERVRFLVNSIQDRPQFERDMLLDNACAGDLELRRDVELYLSADDKTVPLIRRTETGSYSVVQNDFIADPRIGKQFGKYLIRKRLGEGGMGIVYLATDTNLGRDVALKILPVSFSQDRDRLVRFQREARATSLLNHPNIVTVHEIGRAEDCEFIVTEFVEGETLRQRMLQGKPDLLEILKIASQIAGALSAAHKAGIVHRDIKPENVMLRPDGYVKVLDFGLAKLMDKRAALGSGDFQVSGSGFGSTMPGTILGTVAYISPEQVEGVDVDARTDIWGLGVLLYEMVAGTLPFDGPSPSHTLVAILEQQPAPFESPSLELSEVIAKALRKNKAERYQTADEIFAELVQLKRKLGYVSDQKITAPAVAVTVAESVARPNPYRNLLWILPSAFVALLILGFGLYGLLFLLLGPSESKATNSPIVSHESPTPSVTAPSVSPSPTPAVVYADPTPLPTATPDLRARTEEKKTGPERKETVAPPTGKRADTRKEPKRTPKSTQDPNCVFTNSCH